jgi:hypothetical protein
LHQIERIASSVAVPAGPSGDRPRSLRRPCEVQIERRTASFGFGSIEEGWKVLERSTGPHDALHQIFGT